MGAAPSLRENLRLPKGEVKVEDTTLHEFGELAERANRIAVHGADEWDEAIGALLGDLVSALFGLADRITALEAAVALQDAKVAS